MDRNIASTDKPEQHILVALLTEGVDRNLLQVHFFQIQKIVALLTEGVDRNSNVVIRVKIIVTSPSSRRAWIEISAAQRAASALNVALLTEGVDRNVAAGSDTGEAQTVALLTEGVDRNTHYI